MPARPSTIALVFDFDDTLAPDSTSRVLEAIGVDSLEFWARHRELMAEGWDQVPAWMHMLLEASAAGGGSVTRDLIQTVGTRLQYFPGVLSMFKRYKSLIEADPGYTAHFYVVSGGLGDLIRASKIARYFNDLWGSDFAYDASGAIVCPKNVISFTDKTRCLFQISKGLVGPASRTKPFAVNEKTSDFPVPFKNMIFVGDGYTDIPCFVLVEKGGGRAIAAYDRANREKMGRAYGFIDDRRVSHVEPAVYTKGSGADSAITLAITDIKARILQERS